MILQICDMCGEELTSENLRKLVIVDRNSEAAPPVATKLTERGFMIFDNINDTIRDVDLCSDCARKVIRFIRTRGTYEVQGE